MARSRRKYPVVRQERVDKKAWNRRVRRTKCMMHGAQYKKIFVNFDNWVYRWSEVDARESYRRHRHINEKYASEDDFIENYWKRKIINK